LADSIQLNGQVFDVGVGQMGEYVDVCDCHRRDLPSFRLCGLRDVL
jgi:hypothetical protein